MTPKSLLRGRSEQQFDFDMLVKGWTFLGTELLAIALPQYQRAYAAIEIDDPERRARLEMIERHIRNSR